MTGSDGTSGKRPLRPHLRPAILRTVAAFALCVIAGFAASSLGIPLAWVLGPLLMSATLSVCGVSFWTPIFGQRLGQFVVGLAIGLNLKGAVLIGLAPLFPAMVGLGIGAILIGATIGLVFARFAHIDAKTGFFALMPGGLVEMANIGASIGARHEPIAITQAVRIAMVVCILPPLVLATGTAGSDVFASNAGALPFPLLAVTAAAGFLGVAAAYLSRLNNHWMIGALIGAGSISAFGIVDGTMPTPLFWTGQLLLGVAIGSRFQRDIVRRLSRYIMVSALAVATLIGCLLASAAILAKLADIDFATSALATAPGGVPEMAVTAQVMQLNVALVTTFQFVRAFIINAFAAHIFTLLTRLGFFRLGERLLGKP